MSVVISSINCLENKTDIAQPLIRELRRADDFIRLAVMSVYESMAGQPPIDNQDAADWGLVVGTSFGPMETNFVVLDQIVSDEQTSPTFFSHSVFNSAAGYLTRIFNIRGNTSTLTDFYYPFFQALLQGYNIISSGQVKRCFVLQVESYSHLLHDAILNAHKSAEEWPMGAIAWLLEDTHTADNPLTIQTIKIEATPNLKTNYMGIDDTLTYNEKTFSIPHPLAAPLYLSDKLSNSDNCKCHHFQITGSNGNIKLQIGPSNHSP